MNLGVFSMKIDLLTNKRKLNFVFRPEKKIIMCWSSSTLANCMLIMEHYKYPSFIFHEGFLNDRCFNVRSVLFKDS